MKVIALIASFSTLMVLTSAQRGSYAGSRPINNGIKGNFPEQQQQQQQSIVANRFGDNTINANNQNDPLTPIQSQPAFIDPYNNYYYLNQINQLPQNQLPFWFVNRDIIDAHLNRPQINASPLANRGSFMGRRRRR